MSAAGDAIAMRFGQTSQPGNQTVLIIGGGTKESGEALVNHVTKFYGTDTLTESSVRTHADHASGRTEVIEGLSVKKLIMHQPWKHVANIDELLKDADMSPSEAVRHFKKFL